MICLLLNKVWLNRYHLKNAVLEGCTPFIKAHGMPVFEYIEKNDIALNQVMYNLTTIVMKKILEIYNGFEGLKEVVDVGGGFGANLKLLVSKHPQIKGINFDLPCVVKDAPACPDKHKSYQFWVIRETYCLIAIYFGKICLILFFVL